jgi:hypothetical protein
MTHNSSEGAARRPAPDPFAPGDRVRISSGKLTGLTGVVVRLPGRPKLALKIDGWPAGTYILVKGADVQRLSEG